MLRPQPSTTARTPSSSVLANSLFDGTEVDDVLAAVLSIVSKHGCH